MLPPPAPAPARPRRAEDFSKHPEFIRAFATGLELRQVYVSPDGKLVAALSRNSTFERSFFRMPDRHTSWVGSPQQARSPPAAASCGPALFLPHTH